MISKLKKHRVLLITITIPVMISILIIGYFIYEDKKFEQNFLEKFENNKKNLETIKNIIFDDADKNINVFYSIEWKDKKLTRFFSKDEDDWEYSGDLYLSDSELDKIYKIRDELFTNGMSWIEVYQGQFYLGWNKMFYAFSEDGSEPNENYLKCKRFKKFKYTIEKLDNHWYQVWSSQYPN